MMNRIGIYYAYWEQNWSTDIFSYPKRVKQLGFDILALLHKCPSMSGMI